MNGNTRQPSPVEPNTPSPLIACALGRELSALREHLQTPVAFLATGLGQRKTASRLSQHLSRQRPGALIFSGLAGQLDPDLNLGDVVTPAAWTFEDGQAFPADSGLLQQLRSAGWPLQEMGLTVSRPVLRSQRRRQLWRQHSACVCDMESAAALREAAAAGVPALAVKVVSDTSDTRLRDFWKQLDENLKHLAAALDSILSILQLR